MPPRCDLAALLVLLLLLLCECLGAGAAQPLVCPAGQFAYTVQQGDTCDSLASQLCLDSAYFFTVLNNRQLSDGCWDNSGRYFNQTKCVSACWDSQKGLKAGMELCLKNYTAQLPAGVQCQAGRTDGKCGRTEGHCPFPLCCSEWGYCGSDSATCEAGCQHDFGQCADDVTHAGNNTTPQVSCPRNAALIDTVFPNRLSDHMVGLKPATAQQVYHQVQSGETCTTLTNDLCVNGDWWFNIMNGNTAESGGRWNVTEGEYPNIINCTHGSCCSVRPGTQLCLANLTLPARQLCSSDGRCGSANGRYCPYPLCCSAAGWCGVGQAWCEQGCQQDYGMCKHPNYITYSQGYGRCGEESRLDTSNNPNKTALKCPQDNGRQCCSAFGWCGPETSGAHCSGWSGCQSEFGFCNSNTTIPVGYSYPGGRCGLQTDPPLRCLDGQCCSAQGYCGYGPDYCNDASQPNYGNVVSAVGGNLSISYGGLCGPSSGPNGGLRCQPGFCCSIYGICGSASEDRTKFQCGIGCMPAYSAFNNTVGSCDIQLKQLGTGAANAQMNPPRPRVLLLGALQPADKRRTWHLSPLDISWANVRTPIICLLLCEQAPDCRVWAFNSNNNTCFRSSSKLASSRASNTWTSGTRRIGFGTAQLPHTLVVEDGVQYFGAAAEDGNPDPTRFDFGNNGSVYRLGPQFGAEQASAEDCEAWCRKASACRVFVFNKKTRQCFRYNNAYFGGQPSQDFVSGIVRHGDAPEDRLVVANASDPQPACVCDNPQTARELNFTSVPGSTATARFTIPAVCQQRNPGVSNPFAAGYWADSTQVIACQKGFGGVSGRVCVRGVQRCVDLCMLAKFGGHHQSSCDFYDNALARYQTTFLGDVCYWKLMTFGHIGERILCDGRGQPKH